MRGISVSMEIKYLSHTGIQLVNKWKLIKII